MKVPAVVIAFTGTGLATVRCLAADGIPVTAARFGGGRSGWETAWSRRCRTHTLAFPESDHERLLDWLSTYARTCPSPPVVFPTSDATALFLARYADRLSRDCLMFSTSAEEMQRIVNKNTLYQSAAAAGVPIPPMLIEPTAVEVREWCRSNRPPYIAKPFYGASATSSLKAKNRVFTAVDALVQYAEDSGTAGVIIQRMIDSGDGNVCDVYGYCSQDGEILTMASHGRIRQYPPNTGATSYGVIPFGDPDVEQRAFDLTRRLLRQFRYHGIFGIEWLRERTTGQLFLTDFNARPFSSIGHLAHAGLNLPLLGYRELTTRNIPTIDAFPALKPSRWMDFNCDIRSFHEVRKSTRASWRGFVADLLRTRYFAFFDVWDPGPALARGKDFLGILLRFSLKRKGR